MRFFLGMDDTDTFNSSYGTGKVARWFEPFLPEGFSLMGVVRQQLLLHRDVPFTSHNSGACLVIKSNNGQERLSLLETAIEHIKSYSLQGSDPGVCLAAENDPGLQLLTDFAIKCTQSVVSQSEAWNMAEKAEIHLSGHGGTNDGIIGALASVGLTAWGWAGRFIEVGSLRDLPQKISVAQLHDYGILVSSIDRDSSHPAENDVVDTRGWCRPRLFGGRPVLLVRQAGAGLWYSLGEKRKSGHGQSASQEHCAA